MNYGKTFFKYFFIRALTKYLKIISPLLLFAWLLYAQNQEVPVSRTEIEEQNNYTIENITVSDGFHGNKIYDVLQGNLGFLWLASANGLQKYDGGSGLRSLINFANPEALRLQ